MPQAKANNDGSISKSQPQQVRATLRKKQQRAERLAADTREAQALGISVDELRQRRFQKTNELIAAQKANQRRLEAEGLRAAQARHRGRG